jgi:hypothetical protein
MDGHGLDEREFAVGIRGRSRDSMCASDVPIDARLM